jgi:hypothetical protein
MTQQSEPASSLDDPRLLFFLEHEEQLRDWAALSTEVFEAVEATLQQLGLELGAHPRVAADGIRVSDRVNGETFHAPLLYRDEWCRSTPALPDVAIGLGWDTKVDPRGIWRGASRPYAGVRTAHQDTAGPAIEAALRARYKADQSILAPNGVAYKKGSYWVVYRPLESAEDWWSDLRAWRNAMVNAVIDTWDHWGSHIDDLVREAP